MQVIWSDAAVQAALIQAVGGIVAASIAAIAAAIIGQRIADRKRLREKNQALQRDLAFLLAVEREHCQRGGQKILVREHVRKLGHSWSGRFTPGRVSRADADA